MLSLELDLIAAKKDWIFHLRLRWKLTVSPAPGLVSPSACKGSAFLRTPGARKLGMGSALYRVTSREW